ncbi:hypothetical protein ACFLZ4_00530 [Patescibacteria group bacterium]
MRNKERLYYDIRASLLMSEVCLFVYLKGPVELLSPLSVAVIILAWTIEIVRVNKKAKKSESTDPEWHPNQQLRKPSQFLSYFRWPVILGVFLLGLYLEKTWISTGLSIATFLILCVGPIVGPFVETVLTEIYCDHMR